MDCTITNAKYYIVLDNCLIPVSFATNQLDMFSLYIYILDSKFNYMKFQLPANSNFLDALDTFYKMHKVLGLGFHSHLKLMMNFFEYFVFKTEGSKVKPSSKMYEVQQTILN